jgi:hypothetical protein
VMRMPVQFAPTPNKVVVHHKSANLFNTLLTTNQTSSPMERETFPGLGQDSPLERSRWRGGRCRVSGVDSRGF